MVKLGWLNALASLLILLEVAVLRIVFPHTFYGDVFLLITLGGANWLINYFVLRVDGPFDDDVFVGATVHLFIPALILLLIGERLTSFFDGIFDDHDPPDSAWTLVAMAFPGIVGLICILATHWPTGGIIDLVFTVWLLQMLLATNPNWKLAKIP